MQKVEVQFQFPDSEDRALIRKVQDLYHLQKLMLDLRKSQKYKDLSIGYSIRDWSDGKGALTFYKLSVYFTCCNGRHKNPSIHYLSRDQQNFKLDQRSTYIHCHQIMRKKVPNQILLQFQTKKIPSNRSHQIRKNCQSKNSLLQNIHQLNHQSQEQKKLMQQKFSLINQKGLKINQQKIENQGKSSIFQNHCQEQKKFQQHQKIFHFPLIEQLERIQKIASRRSVLASMGNFAQIGKFKDLEIEFHSITDQQKTKEGFVAFHLFIGFKCCTGINNNFPYLHYIKKGTQNFHLIGYNSTHDHLNGISKKVSHRNKKQINKNFLKIMNKRQNNFYQDHFCQFSSYDENNSKKMQEIHYGKTINQKSQKNHQKNETNYLIPLDKNFAIKEMQKKNQIMHSQQKNKLNKQKLMNSSSNQSKSLLNSKDTIFKAQGMEIQEISKKQLIFYQLQNLSEKVSNFIDQKKWKPKCVKKSSQEMQDQSQSTNNQLMVSYRAQDHKIWTECILEILKFNEIEIIEIQKSNYQGDQGKAFKFQNVLFLNKIRQIEKFNQSIEVYLSLYPIKITDKQQETKILVAYTLTPQNYPKLLWFYAAQKNRSILSLKKIFENNNDTQQYYKVLRESIKYFNLKKTNFIYTSLDHNLLNSLDKICQMGQLTNSEFKFQSFMHFQCLKSILDGQRFPQNYLLQDQIRTRIQKFSNQEIIEDSYKALKNIFDGEGNKSDKFLQGINNPRVIFQKYLDFTQPFLNAWIDKKSLKLELSLFFRNLYEMTELSEAQNPFNQLQEIFNHFDQFNNFAQTFIFILRTFDSTVRKVPQNVNKRRILPFKVNKIQNQASNYKILDVHRQKFHYLIKNIFTQTVFQLKLITTKLPEVISLTIQYLIVAADKLLLKILGSIDSLKNSKDKLFVDLQPGQLKKTFKVSFIDEAEKKNFKQASNNFYFPQKNKKWCCTCNFYKRTGIPCEHEILVAILNKSSLLNQIHSCWKKDN